MSVLVTMNESLNNELAMAPHGAYANEPLGDLSYGAHSLLRLPGATMLPRS